MFLTDAEVKQMTGLEPEMNRPSTLRRWLVAHGRIEDVDFFKRYDGWYSVMRPIQREAAEQRPRLRLPA